MLVLSRKRNETIHIGDGITITVCRIGDGVVQLGVDAPGQLIIRRGELPPRPRKTKDEGPSSELPPAMEPCNND